MAARLVIRRFIGEGLDARGPCRSWNFGLRRFGETFRSTFNVSVTPRGSGADEEPLRGRSNPFASALSNHWNSSGMPTYPEVEYRTFPVVASI
jgi:hypothetical protein